MLHALFVEEPDSCIFLGDGERDLLRLQEKYPLLPIIAVQGNCDPRSQLPMKLTVELEGHRIFATHGHRYEVKQDPDLTVLRYTAKAERAEIALYGHTHTPYQEYRDGILLLNPGSCGAFHAGYARLFLEQDTVWAELVRL